MSPRHAALGGVLALGACFQSTFLDGLPCSSDGQCDGRRCIDGYCGGRPDGTTGPDPSTTTTDGSQTTTATTTVDPSSSSTTLDESSSSESGCTQAGCECQLPAHRSCDGSSSVLNALELGCAGEWTVVGDTNGVTQSFGAATAIGGFTPRQGQRFAILGSGLVSDLTNVPPKGDLPENPSECNDDVAAVDVMVLPTPLTTEAPVGDCIDDPALIGEHLDCSHTLFDSITDVRDYAELRIGTSVPADARSFSFAFAFSSTEYPYYFGAEFNDLFVAWLQSDAWTGNVAFAADLPISVNSDLLLPEGATASLVAGTCMQGHGTTGWLTTIAPVEPSSEMVLVFAIFDQGDSSVDSFVFLDAFAWSCGAVTRPETHA